MNANKKIKDVINIRLSKINVDSELENKILNSSCQIKMNKVKPLAMAASICLFIILSIPAMAINISSFNNLIYLISPQTAQFLQPVEMVSEDNNIRMEVIAAMNDNETAIIYLNLVDLAGNRIDETTDLYNYSINGANIFTHELVNYDKKTKTATIRMIANGGNKLNGKKVTVKVDSFLSGKEYERVNTNIIPANMLLNTPQTALLNTKNISGCGGTLFENIDLMETVEILKPDQINKEIPNINFVHISHIGFIKGNLHIQTKWKDSIDNHGLLYLESNLGERINPSNVYFGVDESKTPVYGREYIEYIFNVSPKKISNYSVYGHFVKVNNYIKGKWQTTFKIKSANDSKLEANNINLGGLIIDKILVTPIGVYLTANINSAEDININIIKNDGTLLSLNNRTIQKNNDKLKIKYMSTIPINLNEIKAVSINGSKVNIN